MGEPKENPDEQTRRIMHGLVAFDKALLERLTNIYDDLDQGWLNHQHIVAEFDKVYEAINGIHAEIGLMKLALFFVKKQIADPNSADSHAAWVLLNRLVGGATDELSALPDSLPKVIPAPHNNAYEDEHSLPAMLDHSKDGIRVSRVTL